MNLTLAFAEKSFADSALPAILAALVFLIPFLIFRIKSRNAAARRPQTVPRRQPPPARKASPPPRIANDLSIASVANASPFPLPWFLLLGPADSGKSSLLNGLHRALSFRDRTWVADLASGVARWHFAGGEVFEVAGSLFAPSNNGDGAEKEWKSFLSHLQQQRPRRPVDGIVLTVPCTYLAGDQALSSEELQRQALQLSKRLKLLRDQLGFCVPVYLVVTKCDTIAGYGNFIKAQLASHFGEIFGWSNPYNLDAPFDPQWTAQAFAEVHRVLSSQRAGLFARPSSTTSSAAAALRDELFMFPMRFQELQSPLATYLEQLFQNIGHRDAFQFRGIYFAGRSMPASTAFEEIRPENDTAHGHGFTADLFEKKIFPERGLARPLETAYAHRSTEVNVTRGLCAAAALLLFPAAFLGWYNLSKISRNTLPHLQQLRASLAQEKDGANATSACATIYTAQTLSGRNFQSVLLPASLLSSLDQEVQETMPPLFNRLVYPGLRAELEQRTSNLLRTEPTAGNSQAAATTSAAQRLSNFTDSLLSLENNIVLFNSLAPTGHGQGQGKDMLVLAGSLSPGTFTDVPKSSTAGLDAILHASSGTPIDGQPWNKPAAEKLESLATNDLRQSIHEEQLLTSLDAVTNQINLLEEDKLDSYEQLNGLLQSLGQVQTQLAAPDLQWIAGNEEKFQLPTELNQTLNRIFSRSAPENVLLCDAVHEENSCANLQQLKLFIEQMARTHLEDLRKLLLNAQTTVTGPLVATTDAKLQLSQPATDLQGVLNNFLKLPFVAHEGTARIRDVEAGQQLFWDNDRLQAAIEDKQAYDKFFESQLANTSSDLQETFEDVALSRLDANMVDAAASAQHFSALPSGEKTNEATTDEIRAFQAASSSLEKVLNQFAELHFDDDYQDLQQASTGHALMMLTRLDRAFETRHFYWPPTGNFESWTGDTLPSTAAYGTHTADDMASYLAAQRQDVQQYVSAAQPLVAFLQQFGPKNQKQISLTVKWQGIVSDLQKYQAAADASGLGSVEDLLANTMDKTAPPDCKTPSSPVSSSLVYFVQVRRSLERSLDSRCHSLSNQSAFRQYNQIADFFNQRLAGKFPFSAPPDDDSAQEADPADLAELFRRLDVDGNSIRQGLQNPSGASPNTVSKLTTFLNQIDALRPLFASLSSGQSGAVPAWDVSPTFRVNRNHEINGNQIMDWTLQAGDSTFHSFDTPSAGRWTLGEPVKLVLRWAKDSPQQPFPVAPASANAGPRTIIFEYHDAWSLLRMLAQHTPASSDFDYSVDSDPQTLIFTAGQKGTQTTKAQPAESLGKDSQLAKVFVRIRIYAPGKTDALKVPSFPTQAPAP